MMEKILLQYAEKEKMFGDNMREVERVILLRVVDAKWMEHIDNMEQLRQGINLRAYAQRDPVVEYKFEAMDMFEEMTAVIKEETINACLLPNIRNRFTHSEQPGNGKDTVICANFDIFHQSLFIFFFKLFHIQMIYTGFQRADCF